MGIVMPSEVVIILSLFNRIITVGSPLGLDLSSHRFLASIPIPGVGSISWSGY